MPTDWSRRIIDRSNRLIERLVVNNWRNSRRPVVVGIARIVGIIRRLLIYRLLVHRLLIIAVSIAVAIIVSITITISIAIPVVITIIAAIIRSRLNYARSRIVTRRTVAVVGRTATAI